ncbi:MAG: NAD(P)/FAD-dependent oxidoreductase [Asgard group archaeon]|nr:NAD(P)/FAD-dependent oxidoreductase [Asgard group archaeon]
MDSDVVIVGAGPTGTLAAITAKRNGASVRLCDQRKIIGKPDHCAGLISVMGLESLGITDLPTNVIQNPSIKGAKFYSPSGNSFYVNRKNDQAMVINRELFDQYLVSKAQKLDIEIIKGIRVTELKYNRKEKAVDYHFWSRNLGSDKSNQQLGKAFVGIIAEGRKNQLTAKAGFKRIHQDFLHSGYQLLVDGVKDLDSETVELFVGNKIAPGFFAWIIPISDTQAKVGLASNEGLTRDKVSYFMRKNPITKNRFIGSKIMKSYSGEVIVRGLLPKTYSNGIVVVGDAAGQTKSTTGGGVITGGQAAIIAGKIAAKAVTLGDNRSHMLHEYDKLWKKQLKPQLKKMGQFRWLIDRLTDKAIEKAFDTVIANDLVSIINERADIDRQADVIRTLVRHPAVIKLAFRVLPNLQF